MASTAEAENRKRLLNNVKKEVKQIMEESVTKKFVHEESSSITSLCGTVECCLQHGLRKRALGLFKNSTTTALLNKVSKTFEPAQQVVKQLAEMEQNQENSKKSLDSNRNQSFKRTNTGQRYLWIRLALFDKLLAKIMDHLVQHHSKYYEKEALIADAVDGPILASLLVGPCALDYTKMKTSDHYWTDPPADELVQRHRIHSSGNHHIKPDSPKRPGLQVRRHTSSSSEENMRTTPLTAKEYVESLHQNAKTQLLYGKNNVIVQPKEDIAPLAGYLSLHQAPEGLSIKWTPNQLMNGCCSEEDESVDRRRVWCGNYGYGRWHLFTLAPRGAKCKVHCSGNCLYWDYAVTIYLDEIVYLHCHQQPDSGGTIVLVGQDGVQQPPIHFPKGGHLLAFLSCLENGLLPNGQLDPPLWSQRGKDTASSLLGKVFPKLKRRANKLSTQGSGSDKSEDYSVDEDTIIIDDEEEATDYVFRIIASFRPESLPEEIVDPKAKVEKSTLAGFTFPWQQRDIGSKSILRGATSTITRLPAEDVSIQECARAQEAQNNSCVQRGEHRSAVKQLCDTMKTQIVSRAFYGWLSHCRHLKTVRTHLSGLVNSSVIAVSDPHDASKGLTEEIWREMTKDGMLKEELEVYRLVYYGAVAPSIRKEVWPYLLGHYVFNSTQKEREEHDVHVQQHFEKTMSEWLAIEAIVQQRDKEVLAANLAKLSGESQDGHIPLMRKDSSLSNDVFLSVDSDDFSHPETVPEETSSQLVTPTMEHPNDVIGSTKEHPLLTSVKSSDSKDTTSPDSGIGDSIGRSSIGESKRSDSSDTDKNIETIKSESDDMGLSPLSPVHEVRKNSIIITDASVDVREEENGEVEREEGAPIVEPGNLLSTSTVDENGVALSASRESLMSPSSPMSNASNGGIYSAELLDNVALNLHRIDKDVQRCDRNYWYFTPNNLEKLRNIMCTYVWEHLEVGYVQGMCDLVAPLLVMFDDEAKTYSCFGKLMKRMSSNFPHGGAMDTHFANMRSLIQILDPELFEHMHQNGDYTHFYFCYRWFLLDFKREMIYDDVFIVWETIWTAKHISSPHFVLFIALALVEYYREIIMDNNMDFTDIIKFFNEMAERHPAKQVLRISRDLVYKLQDLIESK